MKNILLFDNYDSFTYNLYHYLSFFRGYEVDVRRNDKISLAEVDAYDLIVLSPGPGIPEESGILLPLINEYSKKKKMLGVCLGLQAIVISFGGKIRQLKTVQHGKTKATLIKDQGAAIFKGMSGAINCGRYHSWVADEATLPECFDVTATDEDDVIMAIQHKSLPLHAVQFHPESIMTENGLQMIENWLNC
ncbi:MAG: aminodeoxychorismate/anthranilate synthase component II [Bacteroidia bacterium]|nr:aminodeoxychorismate/anthranilate synthase component II [Bacteroidia bacterium]